jgi:hypothetical protein
MRPLVSSALRGSRRWGGWGRPTGPPQTPTRRPGPLRLAGCAQGPHKSACNGPRWGRRGARPPDAGYRRKPEGARARGMPHWQGAPRARAAFRFKFYCRSESSSVPGLPPSHPAGSAPGGRHLRTVSYGRRGLGLGIEKGPGLLVTS